MKINELIKSILQDMNVRFYYLLCNEIQENID